jgi:hypothetical protein
MLQVVFVDHDADPDLVRVDEEAAEAIAASCTVGPLTCMQVSRGMFQGPSSDPSHAWLQCPALADPVDQTLGRSWCCCFMPQCHHVRPLLQSSGSACHAILARQVVQSIQIPCNKHSPHVAMRRRLPGSLRSTWAGRARTRGWCGATGSLRPG